MDFSNDTPPTPLIPHEKEPVAKQVPHVSGFSPSIHILAHTFYIARVIFVIFLGIFVNLFWQKKNSHFE